MSYIHFTFATSAFGDPDEIRKQNVNEIEGNSLARWLSGELKSRGIDASEVWAEDHGWDFSIMHAGAKYLCACSREDGEGGPAEAHVTLHKSRSVMDKMMGRNKLDPADAAIAAIRSALTASADVNGLEEDTSR